MRSESEIREYLGFKVGKKYKLNGKVYALQINMFGEWYLVDKNGDSLPLMELTLTEVYNIKEVI